MLSTVWPLQVFYGREQELDRIQRYVRGESGSDKPLVLYGEGGCGKTSLLAMSAGKSSAEWFPGARPLCVIRFLGTTPDSSALTPTLISICQQISYNFMLPYEDIPDDLVPLTAHFKHLLTCASKEQPLIVFLDSVDQLTGAQDANKVSWLPTRLPPNCKVRRGWVRGGVPSAPRPTYPSIHKQGIFSVKTLIEKKC